MAKTNSISVEILHQLLICDAEAGTLTWRFRPREFFKTTRAFSIWNKRFSGKPALNFVDENGYCTGRIFYKLYKAHRVIWAMHYGKWPDNELDHEKGKKTDNRISKLCEATHQENGKNLKLKSNNNSGVTGVFWYKTRNKWKAEISIDGKQICLGYFLDKDAAIARRKASEIEHGFHPNHGLLR